MLTLKQEPMELINTQNLFCKHQDKIKHELRNPTYKGYMDFCEWLELNADFDKGTVMIPANETLTGLNEWIGL